MRLVRQCAALTDKECLPDPWFRQDVFFFLLFFALPKFAEDSGVVCLGIRACSWALDELITSNSGPESIIAVVTHWGVAWLRADLGTSLSRTLH